MTTTHQDILHFWFKELSPSQWFTVDPDLDEMIIKRFLNAHKQAIAGELWQWRKTPEGRLAEIIILDQFSRNMYRNKPEAFASDDMAIALAQEAIANQADQSLPMDQCAFLYMPFMHSESRLIHEEALKLFSQPGLENNYEYELKHKAIIDRFNRYPHRNKALGRTSTQAEIDFLKEPNSSF